jgi:molybdate transport system substrate-binding protein
MASFMANRKTRSTMRTMPVACRAVGILLAGALLGASVVNGAEIRVMTSGGFTAAYLELKPLFEDATRDKIITLATSTGTGRDSIPDRLQRGEPVDVVIVDDANLDELIKNGKVLAGSKVPLGQSRIGMAVRAGAPKPDISSVEALKRTLLQAKSIAYSASVSGRYLSAEMFPRLGIADQVAAKSKRIEGERVGTVVARGDAEIGFQQVSELLPIEGIDYVGALPPEVQRITVFSAGVAARSKEQSSAMALIKFLASPSAALAIGKSGMEPMASR